MSNSSELIEILVQEREKLQITKCKLGKMASIAHTTIARIESGEMNPTLDMFIKIVEQLGYDLTLTKKTESDISLHEQANISRKYNAQLYEQENKDIDNAIETLRRIREKK